MYRNGCSDRRAPAHAPVPVVIRDRSRSSPSWRIVVLLLIAGALAVWGWRQRAAPRRPESGLPPALARDGESRTIFPAAHLKFEAVTLTDQAGAWLQLSGLDVELSPFDWTAPSVTIQRVAIARALIYHRPQYAETHSDHDPASVDRLGPHAIVIESIAIDELIMLPEATGRPETWRAALTGNAAWHAGGAFDASMRLTVHAPLEARARIDVQSDGPGLPVAYDVAVDAGTDRLRIEGALEPELQRLQGNLTGQLGRLAADGYVCIDAAGRYPVVQADVSVRLDAAPAAEPPGRFDSWLPAGTGTLRLRASGDDLGRQKLSGALAAETLAISGIRANQLSLALEIRDVFGDASTTDFQAVIQAVQYRDSHINQASIQGSGILGDRGQLPLQAVGAAALPIEFDEHTALSGHLALLGRVWEGWRTAPSHFDFSSALNAGIRSVPLRLHGQGTLQGAFNAAGEQRLTLDRLHGTLATVDFELQDRLAVRRTPHQIILAPFLCRAGSAGIMGGGFLNDRHVSARFNWHAMPLNWIPWMRERGFEAVTHGRLSVEGFPGQPDMRLEINATDLGVHGVSPPSDLLESILLQAWTEPTGLALRVVARNAETNRLELNARTPLILDRSFVSDLTAPPTAGLWSGSMQAAVPLETLAGIFLPDDTRRLGGRLGAALQWHGTPEQPNLTGTVTVQDGYFHDLVFGTRLHAIDIVVRGDRAGLTVETATARDRGNGRASLEGYIKLWPWGRWPHALQLNLAQMRIVERDDVTAFLDGDLKLVGDAAESVLQGDLRLTPVEVRLPERLPAAVPVLPMIDPDAPALMRTAWFPHLRMEVRIHAPDRVFVRNRTVDSEWQGTLELGGTLERPFVEGSLQAVHGRFMVLGRRFDLRHGNILFAGYPVVPQFDAVAETEAGGITARLRLSGTPQQAQWELSSIPELPEDEILAYVFFNRPAGNPTPGQALRMAQAAEALAGGGRLTDVLDHGRRALRVDRFDFIDGQTPEEASRVTVGKYIGHRGFVDLEKDLGRGDGGRAAILVDLTPSISIESTIEIDGGRGIGVRWRHDY